MLTHKYPINVNMSAMRSVIAGLAVSILSGCSDQPSVSDKAEVALSADSQIQSGLELTDGEQGESTSGKARRLYDVAESPALQSNDGDEQQRSGIVTSFRKGVLHLNENGQVFSYPLAHDLVVHYPGGVTGLADLRQGDKVTLILEPRNDSRASKKIESDFVVKRLEKHTESVDRS